MKPRYILVFFFGLVITLLTAYLVFQKNQKQNNWQFFIKDQLGAQSVLNVGRNITFDENNLYFSDGKGLIHSLDKKNGRVNWLKKLSDHSPFEISSDGQHLYIASFDSHIYQIDKNNGYITWSFSIPNQFWPDTEVVFDNNDDLVFFADRAGFLYALEKESGKLIWKKEFAGIDTSKIFIENSIHFGFLSQEDEIVIVDHFPSQSIYYIDKKSGEILSTLKSTLKINIKEIKEKFDFDNLSVKFEQNVIDQPKINFLDQNSNLLWSYRTENRMNRRETYQNEQRLYYLNADNTILESIYIGKDDPNKEFFTKINFALNENYAAHHPYKNSNPQVNSEEVNYNLILEINKKIDQIKYLFKNIKKIFSFSTSYLEKQNYLEFDLIHEENFYKNVYRDVKIDAKFKNQETNQEISVKGFYFDHNTWKIRARLPKGTWDWSVKIKTKYISKKIKGSLQIEQESKKALNIMDGSFVDKNGEIFFPLGIQDVILDQSKDGSDLNNMGYAKNSVPGNQVQDYNFLSFSDYLDLYKKEAKLNIFRYGPDNWAPSIWQDLSSEKNFTMNVKGNLQGDEILAELQKREFKIMMSVFAFYPPYTSRDGLRQKENKKVLENYLDYVIARYASSIDIWELTNEATPPLQWQNFISDYIAKNDPYKHPITTSLEEPKLNNSDLLSIHLYIQKPNNNYHLLIQLEELLKKQDQKKAIIISEFGFQVSNYFLGSADWLRKFAWITAMRNVGLISWNTGHGLYENPSNGNIYLGPEERFYMKTLKDFLPKMKIPLEKKFEFAKNGDLAIYSMSDKESKLFYVLNLKEGSPIEHQLQVEDNQEKSIKIINPKTNDVVSEFKLNRDDKFIKLPIIFDDLAIKITNL